MIDSELSNPSTLAERLHHLSFGFWLLVSGSLIILTQFVRVLVYRANWETFLNEKFAFSLNLPTPVMYLLYLIAVAFIGHYLITHWSKLFTISQFGFVLILTGGLSNLLERIITGHVVDYFYIANGVLNLADFYIIIGIVLIFAQRGYRES